MLAEPSPVEVLTNSVSAGSVPARVTVNVTVPAFSFTVVEAGEMEYVVAARSEERRVGKECRSRGSPGPLKKKSTSRPNVSLLSTTESLVIETVTVADDWVVEKQSITCILP